MAKLDQLKKHLKRGEVYRRSDLVQWSKSVDRHLEALVEGGTLQKLSQGLYYFPEESAFGNTPPEEETLIKSFLKDILKNYLLKCMRNQLLNKKSCLI